MASDTTKHIREKIPALMKYAGDLESRLKSEVPPKHAHRPKEYERWLKVELKRTVNKIEQLRLSLPNEK